MTRKILTSAEKPLRIAEIPVGDRAGLIGITFAPGKHQADALSCAHKLDLHDDLDHIVSWHAAAVVTLVEAHGLEALRIPRLGEEVRSCGMQWHHWPIKNYGVPDASFDSAWPARSAKLRSIMAEGGRVLVHCKGGLGRAGTIAARLLVESGIEARQAISAVRAARPKAIETHDQERWIAFGRPMPLSEPEEKKR